MKPLFLLASVMFVLFLVVPNNVEAQKRTPPKIKTTIPVATKCAVTVSADLVPKRTFVVVGCDLFPIEREIMSPDGFLESMSGNHGGIVVLDSDWHVVFTYKDCLACAGSFSNFAGMKKFKGHNALMVKLVGGPQRDDGKPTPPLLLPLYFNGKEFKLGLYSTNNVLP
jgi:hypothetical protein